MVQLMHSFRGTSVPEAILDRVRHGDIAAFCLFAFNVENPAQLRTLTESIHQAAKEGGQPVPLIGIDQEGGQLIAIRQGATELPGNMALGATRSPELAEKAGRVLGRELAAMGLNLNFAPTMDVNINPQNPVIGVRSFGDDPDLVAELGVAMIKGMQTEGVIANAKHFPGHGDTDIDTHHLAPVVAHDMKRLEAVELFPFKAAIRADVGAVMTSHIIFPVLDEENPATISHAILTGFLRERMGYQGLIITDAMDMHAVARMGAYESVTAAINAGVDLVLLGHLPDQIALTDQVRDSFNTESIARIKSVQEKLATEFSDLSVVGCAEHQAIAREIAEQSITLVRDTAAVLPLSHEHSLGVVTVKPENLTPADTSADVKIKLAEAIQTRNGATVAYDLPYQADEDDIQSALAAVEGVETVIVGTIAAENDPSQAAFVNALMQRGQAVIVIALRTPYDLTAFPQVQTYLCTYGIRDVSMTATARVLFGEIPARGVLPCVIPGLLTTA